MKQMSFFLRLLAILIVLAGTVTPAVAGSSTGYQTGFVRWRAAEGGFSSWTTGDGVILTSSGGLTLDKASAKTESDPYAPGGYYGINFYNGGSYLVGETTGPEVTADFSFTEAIASWNADTPTGTWIETLISAHTTTGVWTKWYNLGVWASGNSTITRHSVKLQGDTNGYVAVDTLVISGKKTAADAFKLKFRLFSVDGIAIPTVRNASVAYSPAALKKAGAVSLSTGVVKTLDVPTCSQMVYPDGGNVWCSPTSTSMVLGSWGYMPGLCEARVRDVVAGVFDTIYNGHGNWPFNTAYAAAQVIDGKAMEGYVARFTGLDQLEPWIAAGVPVALSVAWKKGDLTGGVISSTAGHLIVLVGFDSDGNAVVNDPAASSNDGVRATYLRGELESIWLTSSGGTAYLIYPEGQTVPEL